MRFAAIQALHEPYANLYLGDYLADTLDLSAYEHRALRLLLLETWVRGPIGNVRLPAIAGLTKEDWQAVKPSVLPLLRSAQPRIAEGLKHIRAFDGRRLPPDDWHIVRSIVLERDGYACTYLRRGQAARRRSCCAAQPRRVQCPRQSHDRLPALQSVEGIEDRGGMGRTRAHPAAV